MQQIKFYICKLNTCNTPEDTTFPEVLLLGNCKEAVDYIKEYLSEPSFDLILLLMLVVLM